MATHEDVGRRSVHVRIILIIVLLYKHGLKAPLWSLWRKLEPSKKLMSHSSRCIKLPSVSLIVVYPRCRSVLSAGVLMVYRLFFFCWTTFRLVYTQVGKGCRFNCIGRSRWTGRLQKNNTKSTSPLEDKNTRSGNRYSNFTFGMKNSSINTHLLKRFCVYNTLYICTCPISTFFHHEWWRDVPSRIESQYLLTVTVSLTPSISV